MNHVQFSTRIGVIGVTWTAQGQLSRLDWYQTEGRKSEAQTWSSIAAAPKNLGPVLDSLQNYFENGEPLSPIPWAMIDSAGWSEFQFRVYQALVDIPHGETRTYAWVARKIGRIGKLAAPRAVGQALRKNPLMIIIPCHRIVSSENTLGGFMGASDPNQPELQLKSRLLEVETRYLNPVFPFLVEGVA